MSHTDAPTGLTDGVEPFSLYIQLEKGRFADLEVVSKAALAFTAALRDAAFIVDPSIEIRIEMQSGTKGSLRFNTLIRALHLKDALSRANLKSLGCVCLVWFAARGAEYTYEKILDHFFSDTSSTHLSQNDKEEIARLTAEIVIKRIALDHVQSVYKNLNQDSAIIGVGGARSQKAKPKFLVPRSEFPSRSGVNSIEEMHITNRTRNTSELVTLISPVLLDESPRRWKVRGAEGEFGATMKDDRFLKSLSHGQIKVPMVSNIRMSVDLQTKEVFSNGVWEVQERNIMIVRRLIQPALQGDLDLPNSPTYETGAKPEK